MTLAPRQSRQAAIFHNGVQTESALYHAIQTACQLVDLPLVGLGTRFNHTVDNPSAFLCDCEVVFAAGRSAIEALACGASVVLITRDTLGPLVTPENFDQLMALNFCAEIDAPKPTAAHVIDQLQQISPATRAAVTARVRCELTLSASVQSLVEHYQALLATHAQIDPTDPLDEIRSAGAYILSLAEKSKGTDAHRAQLIERIETTKAQTSHWKQRATRAQDKLSLIESQLQTTWLRRRLWRQLRRLWEANAIEPR
jgi:hypothetical protein